MINWELPLDAVPCPHCGSTDTRITLQLLGLIRYACNACRKSFAVKNDAKISPPLAATDPAS
jgi:transposase-like protein